ncbi:ice-binding family protein [Daejeonella oryzae]|uniref:ice-binding family protein n=1 Tax=Daejeonella oryzae TaxID=1122943 RepID=UPI0004186EFD|nr:ice-binding family protein [Daejeonella oryzae]
MSKTITFKTDSTQVHHSRSYSKIYNTIWSFSLLLIVFLAGCKKDNFEGEIVGLCPVVVSTDPTDKAIDVVLGKVISATFNTDMEASTINNTTFTIKQGTTLIKGTVAPTANGTVFTFKPDVALLPFTTYTGTISTGATDTLRTAMVEDYVWSFTTIPQVSLSANPAVGGTLLGAGTFANGSVVTVSAVPNTGFTFTSWTDNGVVASLSPSYQFTLAGNRALVANFAAVTVGNFAVNLSSNPAAGGITAGGGQFSAGSLVTVTASPNTGYTFVNWTDNGAIVSTSSSFQFLISGNRTLVANYRVVPASQLAVVLSSSPTAGGTTDGEGSYNSGSSVTVTSNPNPGYTFTNWTDKATGVVASTSANYTFVLNANRTLVANFTINTYTLTVNAVNGNVVKNPNQANYNHGSTVQLTATANAGFVFSSWSGDASGSANPLTVNMNSNKIITANFTPVLAIGPGPINLGLAADYSILTKSGISSTGITSVEGNIGVSPAAATSITGFGLIMDTNGQSSHTTIATHVTGKVYASDYAAPTPSNLTVAIANMETAYTTANNLVTPAPILERGAGNISGLTLAPGLYKWSTGVLIDPNASVTLSGGPNDTWVFQIAQDLTLNNSAQVRLLGGAQAKNITWVVAGQAVLQTNTVLFGNILSKTLISLNTGSKVTGRLLAQTAVTLNTATVIKP